MNKDKLEQIFAKLQSKQYFPNSEADLVFHFLNEIDKNYEIILEYKFQDINFNINTHSNYERKDELKSPVLDAILVDHNNKKIIPLEFKLGKGLYDEEYLLNMSSSPSDDAMKVIEDIKRLESLLDHYNISNNYFKANNYKMDKGFLIIFSSTDSWSLKNNSKVFTNDFILVNNQNLIRSIEYKIFNPNEKHNNDYKRYNLKYDYFIEWKDYNFKNISAKYLVLEIK